MLTSTVCAAVSAAGLGIALLTAYRRRFLAATRIAAFALVPIGLVLTGIVDWITDVVFDPTVWAGFGVLALSAVLFLASRVAERGRLSRAERRAAEAAARPAVAPGASSPSPARAAGPRIGRRSQRKESAGAAPGTRPASGAGTDGPDDFRDIEAILKKHGI
ncbi:hypothetical protein [Streptomyces sp. URMC 123]|uniref:hypothetical protein n=1 Tax=Streptomyces sp. URMC 123 TaxID=3423403 RepID=UPI003F1D5ABE